MHHARSAAPISMWSEPDFSHPISRKSKINAENDLTEPVKCCYFVTDKVMKNDSINNAAQMYVHNSPKVFINPQDLFY